jgi:hypothetical protein
MGGRRQIRIMAPAPFEEQLGRAGSPSLGAADFFLR